MIQILNMLKFSNFFCFEYKLLEGCSKCKYKMETNSNLNPYIIFRENNLLKEESIPNKINKLMSNELLAKYVVMKMRILRILTTLHFIE